LWQSFKRQSIQEAVIRLMCRDGLKSVTMERVAQEVGIAKGTVYLHYRDKQDLLDAVKESSLAPLSAKIDEIFATATTPDRKLRAYALRYLTYFDERRDLFRILLYEREVTRVQGSRYQADRYRHLVEGTAGVIREGIADGSFREVNAHHVAAMFVEASIAIVNQRLLTHHPAAVEDDAALIADVFLRGIAAPGRRSPV
ncbi:MAG: Transcriptional regulator, TetR family, partial [Acidobacteria bacterium]|nr:Transcriptional regulator, TetR family [Acidobacteriota bacterium]